MEFFPSDPPAVRSIPSEDKEKTNPKGEQDGSTKWQTGSRQDVLPSFGRAWPEIHWRDIGGRRGREAKDKGLTGWQQGSDPSPVVPCLPEMTTPSLNPPPRCARDQHSQSVQMPPAEENPQVAEG